MKNRSPLLVFLFSFLTLGIYSIYWLVVTKDELNKSGATIPTAWLIIIPFVSIWWLWKYSEGVEHVTNNKMSGVLAFVLMWLLGAIGYAIVQDSFNKTAAGTQAAPIEAPATPPAPTEATATTTEVTTPTTPPAPTNTPQTPTA
jgi:hypothetical protein